ncbi:MAG: hypothetical protein HKN24_07720 [Acidimicrobiales bacterium]|nr:hypothetical protein [Acidimicrobiales bacterium]
MAAAATQPKLRFRLRVAMVVVLLSVATPPGPAEAAVVSQENSLRLETALGHFANAGLALPPVDVRFYDDTEPCQGYSGLFQSQYQPVRVLICSDLPFVLPHELAHAWADAYLSDREKDAFVEWLGLPSWNDHADEWDQRGTEMAAFTIQQNLVPRQVPPTDTWLERITNYELLTGRPSPLRQELDDHTDVPPAQPPVQMNDLPPELGELVTWAIGLFRAADLELPPLRYLHHTITEPCHGTIGSQTHTNGISTINLCMSVYNGVTEVLVLHETAHAWAAHSLAEDRQAAFKELRGWEHWRNYEAASWHENGTEQVAEFLVWGLLDRPYSMIRMYHSGCDELELGFELLTGRPPLHGFRDKC